MKYAPLMDLYTDFLTSSPNVVSALLLSEVLNNSYSHDSITRMLAQDELDQKTYWRYIKSFIRQIERPDGVISIDDTIEVKPHSDENELVSWHFDHSKGVSVKGINIVTFTYVKTEAQKLTLKLPVAFELVRKDGLQTKTTKNKEGKFETKTTRCASVSKNELLRRRLHTLVYQNKVLFKYAAFDTWYSSAENLEYIVQDLKKHAVCTVKENRLVTFDLEKPKKEQTWLPLSQINIEPDRACAVQLKDLPFPVLVVKKVYHNLDGSVGVQYLVSTDIELTAPEISDLYQLRWSSEELHKSLKQNTALEKMPAKMEKSQANHIFASMIAQLKLEALKIATQKNHYTLKRNILVQALKTAWAEIQRLKELCIEKNIASPNFLTA